MMDWNGNWGSGGWIVMGLMMLAVWGVVAWVAVTALRARRPDVSPSARQVIEGRLARGEITVEEYEALDRTFGSQHHPS
jgi:putative membrane protein